LPGRALLALICLLWPATRLPGSEPDPAGLEHFEKKIRPVLIEHCYECHAADSEPVQGGLLLDTRADTLRGGDSGPAVVPGQPEESLLLQALRYESFEMPPEGQLPEVVVANFEAWIRQGAPDPRQGPPAAAPKRELDVEAGRQFWAFRPLSDPDLPEVRDVDWPESDVDRFLLARLEAEGLQPVEEADRHTLIRRAYFTLIGLPPPPAAIDRFLADPAPLPMAWNRLVDRLLQSPRFGERWGRHWLDVVRFAQSSGGGRTLLFPDAWRYRDYVIDALNRDVPFDQFVREQVAGDLLPADDWRERRRQVVATAFLVLGATNYELQDKAALDMDIVDEQLDTLGKAFLGMTVSCARCHDHKFDPIPTRDYYALAGILRSTRSAIHSNVSTWSTCPLPVPDAEEAALQQHEARLRALRERLAELKREVAGTDEARARTNGDAEMKRIQQQVKQLERTGPQRPRAMAVADDTKVGDIPIAIRGVVHNQGSVVPRGVLTVAAPGGFAEIPPGESGRRQLADWIASPDNPLTARVLVNRVWYWLFGQGLVRSVDNFGATGDRPSHPELLDHLARQFMADGWSVQRLVRRIVTSRAFRLSCRTDGQPRAREVDPDNRLLWRMRRQRLDAESIRDALLHVGGHLDTAMGGPNMRPGTKSEYRYRFESARRSVYVPVFRNTLPTIFETFDFANPNLPTGQRTTSTIAPQALLLMNEPFVMEQARSAARRLLAQPGLDTTARLRRAYHQVLGRPPSARELKLASRFVGEDVAAARWGLVYQTLFQSLDFRYLN
jgi:hypothetical protein